MEPSASVEAEPSKATANGAAPLVDDAFATAVGGVFVATAGVVTTTGVLVVLLWPLLSVTVRTVLYVPAEVKVCAVLAAEAVAPSPKAQAYERMAALDAAVEPAALKVTVSGARPAAVEDDEMTAVGGAGSAATIGAVAVIVVAAVLVRPVEPVTVRRAVKEPLAEYTWLTELPVAVEPSPKSQRYEAISPVEDEALKATESGAVPLAALVVSAA